MYEYVTVPPVTTLEVPKRPFIWESTSIESDVHSPVFAVGKKRNKEIDGSYDRFACWCPAECSYVYLCFVIRLCH